MADEVIKIRAEVEDKASKQLNLIKTALTAAFGAFTLQKIANFAIRFRKLIDDVTIYQDKIAKASKATGVMVKDLSSLAFAAERSGANLDAVIIGLRTMMKRATDASYGLKTAERTFEQLGIAVFDSNKNIKDGNQLLLEIAEAFKKETDASKKAALAQELFGRSGIDLIPMLNEGKDGIEALQKKAEELGITFDEKTAAKAEEFRDRMTDLDAALKGAEYTITEFVVPALVEMLTTMTDGLTDIKNFTQELENTLTLRLLGKDINFAKVFKDVIENMARGKSVFDSFQFAIIESAYGVDLLDKNLGKVNETKKENIEVTDQETKSEKDLLKAFTTELEWLEKLNEKNQAYEQMRLDRQREHYQELEDLKQEATENLDKLRQDEWDRIQEDAKIQYEIAKQAVEDEEKLRRESLERTREIERQKRAEQKEALLEFQDNMQVWAQESKTAFELYKAYASAEAMISAVKSAQKIFEAVASQVWLGPIALPAAIAASAIAMAAGVARAGMIASQDYQGRAQGGNVQAGMPYIVGEQGREAFVPQVSGNIISNAALKRMGGKTVNIYVSAIDTQSFRDFLRRGGSAVLESEMAKGRLF